MRFEVHRAKLPDLPTVTDSRKKTSRLLLLTHLKPIFNEDNSCLDHGFFPVRTEFHKPNDLLLGAKPHHALNPGAVVPTAIENNYFSSRRKMRDVALDVHLRLFSLGRRRQCNESKHSRANPFRNALYDPALPCRITPFEDHNDLQSLVLHPQLQFDELGLQLCQMTFELLVLELRGLFLRGA